MKWKATIQNGKALRAFISDSPSGMDFDAMAFVEGCTLIYKCYEEMAKHSLFQDEGSYERDELEEQMLLLEGEARTPNYDPLPDLQEAERGDIEEHLANCGFDSFSQWFDCRLHELYDFADKYRLFIAL